MGGYLGIGGSSAKTDRGNQLAATQGDWNIYSQGLGFGVPEQNAGTGTLAQAKTDLGPAKDYYSGLLKAGRTETAQNSAPAINTTLAQSDAQRNSAGNFGTARTGGTAALNRDASTQTQSKMDDIITSTLNTGKETGAKGMESVSSAEKGIASTQLTDALSMLGLSSNAVNDILTNATQSRGQSQAINTQTQAQWGQLLGAILLGG